MNKKYLGGDFDGFLAEHGVLTDAESIAIQRVFVYQISNLMEKQGLTKTQMAERLNISQASLNRLLDPAN
jgi:predicted XRE-type DNA-binding protein